MLYFPQSTRICAISFQESNIEHKLLLTFLWSLTTLCKKSSNYNPTSLCCLEPQLKLSEFLYKARVVIWTLWYLFLLEDHPSSKLYQVEYFFNMKILHVVLINCMYNLHFEEENIPERYKNNDEYVHCAFIICLQHHVV